MSSAIYECQFYYDAWIDTASDRSHKAEISVKETTTKDGKSYSGERGKPAAPLPPIVSKEASNEWLHPDMLPMFLDVVRTDYLSEDREVLEEFLLHPYKTDYAGASYVRTLALEPPKLWGEREQASWLSARSELNVLRQRRARGLDYFGKPAGHMPLLAFSGALNLYEMDAKAALRMMLLASWVERRAKELQEATEAMSNGIGMLADQNAHLADTIVEQNNSVKALTGRIDELESQLNKLEVNLSTLRSKLYNEAAADLNKKAQIKAAINLAAGLCQVIPYGQPALGGVASIAASGSELLYSDADSDQVLGKMKTGVSDLMTRYKEAQKEVATLIKEAKDEATARDKLGGEKLTLEKYDALSKQQLSSWSQVKSGIGPAVAHFNTAFASLQVPQSTIDAEIEKLAAKSPEWKKIADEIKDVLKTKVGVFDDMVKACQLIGQSYSRLTENSVAMHKFNEQVRMHRGLVDKNSVEVIEGMKERARVALTRSLYDLARAYETTVFKPATIDWELASVLEKIEKLTEPQQAWNPATLNANVEALQPIFVSVLDKARNELRNALERVATTTRQREVTFSDPAELAPLWKGDEVPIDPFHAELVLPNWQLAMISDVKMTKCEFIDPPAEGQVIFTLTIAPTGIVRADGVLYGVRQDAPRERTFTYSFSTRKISADAPSEAARDIMNFLIGDKEGRIRNRLARPPAWSDMVLSARFTGLKEGRVPKVKSLALTFGIDATSVEKNELALEVFSRFPGAAFSCNKFEGVASGGMFLILKDRPTVTLKVEPTPDSPEWEFDRWRVNEDGSWTDHMSSQFELAQLKRSARVECRYRRKQLA